jgi:catechol 2,3-dioxygenase-like lactoylglutathione lyase family enzyme
MPRASGCLLAVTLLVAGGLEASQTIPAAPSFVRRVDHITIRAANPRELYAFFTETMQLPVAWPLTSPREGVVTGGVGVGNVNLEAIQFPGQTEQQPRLLGFAFEPLSLDESLRQLTRRGFAVGARREIVGTRPNGAKGVLWTNVTLPQLSDSENPAFGTVHVFLSEYDPAYVDVEQRRERLRKQLVANGGGPLGIVDLREIVIGVRDIVAARQIWERLLQAVSSPGVNTWQVGDGPAIRLISAPQERMQSLILRVASLDRAKAFLRDNGLLGAEADGMVSIDPSKVWGIDLRLIDK